MASPLALRSGEPVSDGLRRVVLAALDDAIERLTKTAPDEDDIHESRKRLKEVRALARLIGADDLRIRLRDSGRELAGARDAEALIESFDKLRERFRDEWGSRRYGKIRRALVAQKLRAVPPNTTAVASTVRNARGAVEQWIFESGEFDLIARGLRAGYRRARRQMDVALDEKTPPAFHEWRKRVKDEWYHAQFIENASPALSLQVDALKQLSRTLGDHHDLVVLRESYQRAPEEFASRRLLRRFDRSVAARMHELEEESAHLGRWIFGEKPKAWLRRIRGYFEVAAPAAS